MVMPLLAAWGLLDGELVAAWPYVKCPGSHSDHTLHAPCIIFISVGRGCLTPSALQGTPFKTAVVTLTRIFLFHGFAPHSSTLRNRTLKLGTFSFGVD